MRVRRLRLTAGNSLSGAGSGAQTAAGAGLADLRDNRHGLPVFIGALAWYRRQRRCLRLQFRSDLGGKSSQLLLIVSIRTSGCDTAQHRMFGQHRSGGDDLKALTGQAVTQFQQGVFIGTIAIGDQGDRSGSLTLQRCQLFQGKSRYPAAENWYGNDDNVGFGEGLPRLS